MLAEIKIDGKRSVRDLGGKCSLIERVLSEVANIFRNTSRAAGKMKRETRTLNRHTFTTLSQPQETITGFNTLGLNLTQETLYSW
jgi:hypothetical protein